MVKVNVTMKQELVKELVTALDPEIKFVEKKGLSLIFTTPDDEKWMPLMKAALKKDPTMKVLYFNLEIAK